MSTQPATIVQRLWNYCNVLRDDGVSYGDYVDQRRWQAVLKRAFEGKLVSQDPADESASVLLERIRAEKRASLSAGSPSKRRVNTQELLPYDL